jgi:hypothetical protein
VPLKYFQSVYTQEGLKAGNMQRPFLPETHTAEGRWRRPKKGAEDLHSQLIIALKLKRHSGDGNFDKTLFLSLHFSHSGGGG